MRLLLVRHGAASYFERQVVAGIEGCTGLTDEGRDQARKLCRRLQAAGELAGQAVLMSSPLPRAMETASLLSPAFMGAVVRPEPRIEEMNVGVADGLSWSDFEVQFGYFDEKEHPDRIWAPEGESWNMFTGRVGRFLDRVSRDYADTTVAAVTHGGVIDVTMRILLGIPIAGTPATFFPSNTGITEWSFDGAWKLERYNDTSHLSSGT